MATRVLHMCPFNFASEDIRVVGSEIDGGTSLSGISDPVQSDGGGYWIANYDGADFGGPDDEDRTLTLAWRAINAGLSGGQPAVVLLHDQHHQPVGSALSVPHSDDAPFSDDTEYASPSVASSVIAVVNGETGGLNCTILDITFVAPLALIGGERFTYVHPTWGERAAEISSVEDIEGGKRIKFQPPIRGGIAAGDALDFDNVRCRMRRASQPTSALSMGLFSSASIQFVEDMRAPS